MRTLPRAGDLASILSSLKDATTYDPFLKELSEYYGIPIMKVLVDPTIKNNMTYYDSETKTLFTKENPTAREILQGFYLYLSDLGLLSKPTTEEAKQYADYFIPKTTDSQQIEKIMSAEHKNPSVKMIELFNIQKNPCSFTITIRYHYGDLRVSNVPSSEFDQYSKNTFTNPDDQPSVFITEVYKFMLSKLSIDELQSIDSGELKIKCADNLWCKSSCKGYISECTKHPDWQKIAISKLIVFPRVTPEKPNQLLITSETLVQIDVVDFEAKDGSSSAKFTLNIETDDGTKQTVTTKSVVGINEIATSRMFFQENILPHLSTMYIRAFAEGKLKTNITYSLSQKVFHPLPLEKLHDETIRLQKQVAEEIIGDDDYAHYNRYQNSDSKYPIWIKKIDAEVQRRLKLIPSLQGVVE